MKKLIYCLSILCFASVLMTSCEQDGPMTVKNSAFDSDIDQLRDGYDIPGLSHNGRWFIVESEDYLPEVITLIEEIVEHYETSGEEEDTDEFVDDEPALEAFEMAYGHQSFRRMLLKDLHYKLEEGYDPVDALNSQDDLTFSMSESTLLNEDKVIQVGHDIYYYYTGEILIKIAEADEGRLYEILDGGLVQAYHKPNVSFVTSNTFVKHMGGEYIMTTQGGDCTAAFTNAPPTLDPNGLYAVIFTWAEQANLAAWPNVSLTWDFGDGTPSQTVMNNGTVTHVYNTYGTYTVTLNVSSPATTLDPGCEETYTTAITIQEINASLECEDYFCLTLNTIGALSPATLGNLLTDGVLTPNNELAFTLTNALGAIFNHCTATELNSITWTINGDTYTGTSFVHQLDCPDGQELLGTISFGNCSASFTYSTPTTCSHADCTQDWHDQTYSNSSKKICYRTKTVSRYQDIFFGLFGNNKIQAKMQHFKKKSNGNWTKEKKNLAIDADGTLAYNLSCNCEGNFTVDESANQNDKKTLELEKKYNNYSEIHMFGNTYKWFVDFKVQGSVIVNNWDASSNC